MEELMLFTDASADARSKIGFGAYLAVSDGSLSADILSRSVKIRRFEQTSSTKLELQTLLWALSDIEATDLKVKVYSDSQNIVTLNERRDRLERNDYRSKKGERLGNAELYQAFFRRIDQMDCELVKVRGHQKSNLKDDIENFFTLVDRASRKALRNGHL